MSAPEPIPLTGCRHDVFGHALKALGILRALNCCADDKHLDRKAEAWWDTANGTFYLRSPKYPTFADLNLFFEQRYRPTPIFSPWNTGGGLDEKKEVTYRLSRRAVATFLWANKETFKAAGLRPRKHRWKKGQLQFDVKPDAKLDSLQIPSELQKEVVQMGGRRPKQKFVLKWSPQHARKLRDFVLKNREKLEDAIAGSSRTSLERFLESGEVAEEITFTLKDPSTNPNVDLPPELSSRVEVKTEGEKAVLAVVEHVLRDDSIIQRTLKQGRQFFHIFREARGLPLHDQREVYSSLRDIVADRAAIALDAVFATHAMEIGDNPAFLNQGESGNTEIFRTFWSYLLDFRTNPKPQLEAALQRGGAASLDKVKSPGAPFFPDQIETYNNGLRWTLNVFPFCALDYLLAVEGALALRGSAARLLGARSGNFAAFPFVFATDEELTDHEGKLKGFAASVWLPVWDRPATFAELESFILDSQARMPDREARFSAEFTRAIRSQGVDAGFAGYQEFRLKMVGASVPWVCTGRYVSTKAQPEFVNMAELLRPIDQAGFLDQLKFHKESGSGSPHYDRAAVLGAVEEAASEGGPRKCLAILERLFQINRRLAVSERFRKAVGAPVFVPPLPQESWMEALQGLEVEPEFEIARALGSIAGRMPQRDGKYSETEPFLGSILPLKPSGRGWFLPKPPSPQAVWSGSDLCLDLTRVLGRRYRDSQTDDRPALASPFPARLPAILRFLYGGLDDQRVARYTEALSLVGWHFSADKAATSPEPVRPAEEPEPSRPIPVPYAAARALLETELLPRTEQESERLHCSAAHTLALLCQRTPDCVAAATAEALRRLSIVGLRNPYGEEAEGEKPRLAGRDIVSAEAGELVIPPEFATRLAAAVLIPLHWRDHFRLFRTVTLPQTINKNDRL
ncbi:MAG TPA: type I-U CRISPR-associated protein Csx17 [Verrucomicrobiae bacterium]